MASPYEVEVKLSSANNLKNVNWRNGPNCPYVVVWVDPTQKRSTNVDKYGDTQPNWDEKLIIPLPPSTSIKNSILFIDVLHSEPGNKPLIIGSAQLSLDEVQIDDVIGVNRTLKLKRPSGRPQGTIDIKLTIKHIGYCAPGAYGAPPYGVPPPYGSPYSAPPSTTGYAAPTSAPYGSSYGASVNVAYGNPYNTTPPLVGYPVATPTPAPYGYGQSSQQGYSYGQSAAAPSVNVTVIAPEKNNQSVQPNYGYGQIGQQGTPTVNVNVGRGVEDNNNGQQGYGYEQSRSNVNVNVEGAVQEKKKSSNMFGMGAGLAIGAVVGGLGALALEKGIDNIEDEIADRAAYKVEEDEYYDEYYN